MSRQLRNKRKKGSKLDNNLYVPKEYQGRIKGSNRKKKTDNQHNKHHKKRFID